MWYIKGIFTHKYFWIILRWNQSMLSKYMLILRRYSFGFIFLYNFFPSHLLWILGSNHKIKGKCWCFALPQFPCQRTNAIIKHCTGNDHRLKINICFCGAVTCTKKLFSFRYQCINGRDVKKERNEKKRRSDEFVHLIFIFF